VHAPDLGKRPVPALQCAHHVEVGGIVEAGVGIEAARWWQLGDELEAPRPVFARPMDGVPLRPVHARPRDDRPSPQGDGEDVEGGLHGDTQDVRVRSPPAVAGEHGDRVGPLGQVDGLVRVIGRIERSVPLDAPGIPLDTRKYRGIEDHLAPQGRVLLEDDLRERFHRAGHGCDLPGQKKQECKDKDLQAEHEEKGDPQDRPRDTPVDSARVVHLKTTSTFSLLQSEGENTATITCAP